MRRPLRFLLRAVLVSLVGTVVVAWLALAREPLVTRSAPVSIDDVRRARSLLVLHDPRRGRAGAERTITLSQQDATLLAQYAALRWRKASTRVSLRDGSAFVQASLAMPSNPIGGWLNVDAELRNADGIPRIHRLWLGRLPIPAFAAERLAAWLLARLDAAAPLEMARDMVQRTEFSPDSLRVSYTWRAGAAGRVRDLLLPTGDLARFEAYHARLAAFISTTDGATSLTLPQLLTPMLTLASQRSVGADAAAENRAALATLALYVTGRSLGSWMREAARWPRARRRRVTLLEREDLVKHFLVSAIVAAEADRALADAVGLTKEIEDSRGGSGFSFVDLAADRAGTRFGDLAVASPEALQRATMKGVSVSDIMPDVSGLPESLTEAQFVERFGTVGSPRYLAIVSTIEARVAALPLLR